MKIIRKQDVAALAQNKQIAHIIRHLPETGEIKEISQTGGGLQEKEMGSHCIHTESIVWQKAGIPLVPDHGGNDK
jgi:hypothetical protein